MASSVSAKSSEMMYDFLVKQEEGNRIQKSPASHITLYQSVLAALLGEEDFSKAIDLLERSEEKNAWHVHSQNHEEVYTRLIQAIVSQPLADLKEPEQLYKRLICLLTKIQFDTMAKELHDTALGKEVWKDFPDLAEAAKDALKSRGFKFET